MKLLAAPPAASASSDYQRDLDTVWPPHRDAYKAWRRRQRKPYRCDQRGCRETRGLQVNHLRYATQGESDHRYCRRLAGGRLECGGRRHPTIVPFRDLNLGCDSHHARWTRAWDQAKQAPPWNRPTMRQVHLREARRVLRVSPLQAVGWLLGWRRLILAPVVYYLADEWLLTHGYGWADVGRWLADGLVAGMLLGLAASVVALQLRRRG